MWRFVQLSDLHLASDIDGVWNNRVVCSMMPDVMACLRRDLRELQPDFILATGDIVSHWSRDAMFAGRDLMDSLDFRYYPLGGNHDFMLESSRDWFLEAFHASLPISDTVYSFTHENLHICALDPWWEWPDGGLAPYVDTALLPAEGYMRGGAWAVPSHQLEWLNSDLLAHRAIPTLIAVHYPMLPVPQRLCRDGMRNAGHLSNGEQLLGLLAQHPQVKAVLSGHLHMNYAVSHNGLSQIVTASLPEYPVEYKDIHVYPDRLEIFTCSLSDSSFAARSLIDGEGWTAGEACDRTVTIPL